MADSRSWLMPMESVSSGRFRLACRLCTAANAASWAARSSVGSGMAISPRNVRRGRALMALARAGRSAGVQPDLLASPLTLT
ncbi:hypothetical protein D3C76_1622210 [compost metagenome]